MEVVDVDSLAGLPVTAPSATPPMSIASAAGTCLHCSRNGLAVDEDELRQLPVLVDLLTAAAVLGIGRTTAYELVRTSRWPTPVLRLGNRIRIPTAALRELLSLSTSGADVQTRVAGER